MTKGSTMHKVILSESFDPFFNLSFENTLFNQLTPNNNEPTLYLWRNSDVVVIGRFQNPWKECNINKLNDDKVHLMRRDTGGGAVFHDKQNLCFTFIGSTEDTEYRKNNTDLICKALKKLEIDAFSSGRNDIVSNNLKISGSAFREKEGKYIHHGTLLIGTDLTKLQNYLNPDKKKLESKGIESVRARVANLKDFNPSITVNSVENAIIETFCNYYSLSFDKKHYIHKTLINESPELKEEYDRLSSWTWIFGKSPEFTHILEGRFPWGGIEINFLVKNAVIDDISIFSDSLDIEYINNLSNCLKSLIHRKYDIIDLKKLLSDNNFSDIATLCS